MNNQDWRKGIEEANNPARTKVVEDAKNLHNKAMSQYEQGLLTPHDLAGWCSTIWLEALAETER